MDTNFDNPREDINPSPRTVNVLIRNEAKNAYRIEERGSAGWNSAECRAELNIRRAMVSGDRDRLSGIVEVDDTFVGGAAKAANEKPQTGLENP